MQNQNQVRIAIFASGGGSNARTILEHTENYAGAEVVLLVTNNPDSGAIRFVRQFSCPAIVLSKKQYQDGDYINQLLSAHRVDLVVLAGYLKLVPAATVRAFPNRILNIHPALLPAYGGKGMFGMNVHNRVISNGEKASGITIHYVNEVYDDGEILFQKAVEIGENWTPGQLQKEVQKLEHQHFWEVIKKVCENIPMQDK